MWSPLSLFKTKPKKTDKNYKDTTEVEKNAELISSGSWKSPDRLSSPGVIRGGGRSRLLALD